MVVIQLVEPAAAEQQKTLYNSGGPLNRTVSFSIPGDIHWAVVGIVLPEQATPAAVESTLIPAIVALSEVSSVNGDQLWGALPPEVQLAEHEAVLNVTARMASTINDGNGGTYNEQVQKHNTVKPPVGQQWVVLCCRVPSALDNAGVAALRAAIDGIAGTTTVKVLLDGSTPSRAVGDVQLQIAAHLRIEAVVV